MCVNLEMRAKTELCFKLPMTYVTLEERCFV
jgi:hypothetical protein